jgi:hypothetical protein
MGFRRPWVTASEQLAACFPARLRGRTRLAIPPSLAPSSLVGRCYRLSSPRAAKRPSASLSAYCAALAAGVLVLAAGCGSPGSTAAKTGGTSATGTPCGMTRTAANVPVNIQVARGQVSCATAMTVERDYARYIAAGKAPGNGGGGPVRILGWTCQGFPTPVVLKTGQASKCVQGGVEILAILPAPA